MNPHFSIAEVTEGRRMPTRVYARVDSEEDIGNGRIVMSVDAVSIESAEWLLANLPPEPWRDLWASGVGRIDPDRPARGWIELYDRLELAHFEFVATCADAQEIRSLSERSGWLQLELRPGASTNGLQIAHFATLFSPPTPASLVSIVSVPPSATGALNTAFSMHSWPTTPPNNLGQYFINGHASYWAAYDVGQGAANGLLDEDFKLALMHDIGCGVYRNAKTRPSGLVLCHTDPATIVLSHWDTDHWAGARYFAPSTKPNAFLERTWIAPHDTTAGPRHIAFALDIIASGGQLVLTPSGTWKSNPVVLADGRQVVLIRGSGPDRNSAGIAMEIQNSPLHDDRWLLTGDVDYGFLAPHLSSCYVGVSVPHHGAKPSAALAPPPPASPYARLVYSFGPDNSFGHPRQESVNAHVGVGWQHGAWIAPLAAVTIAGGHTLATACHAPATAHLGAALISWQSSPFVPPLPPCGSQCSATLVQS